MGAFLALLSSLLWGTGDFLGGTLSRRAHPVAVIRISQGLAGVALFVIVVATGEGGRTGAIGWGIAAAVLGSVGLGSFYAALAAGTMGVVAPVAATGVVIPVVVGLATGDAPSGFQAAGIVVAIVGVVLASGPERRASVAADVAAAASEADAEAVPVSASRRPLLLAGVAAVGFGSALTLVAQGSETSVAMTLLVMRITTTVGCTALLLTVLRRAPRPVVSDLPVLATISATDAGANGLFAVSSTLGQVSVSAVLASLYPAVTALLAWRLHHESLRPIQVAGVVATLVGVAFIAGG